MRNFHLYKQPFARLIYYINTEPTINPHYYQRSVKTLGGSHDVVGLNRLADNSWSPKLQLKDEKQEYDTSHKYRVYLSFFCGCRRRVHFAANFKPTDNKEHTLTGNGIFFSHSRNRRI